MDSPASAPLIFTLVKWLTVLAAVIFLLSLAIPATVCRPDSAGVMQAVSNGKQLLTLALAMANDAGVTNDPKLGWPGDLVKASGPAKIVTLGDYVDRMIEYDYVKRGDVPKLFATRIMTRWDGVGQLSNKDSAFKIFKVTKEDAPSTIFAETWNYTYNQPLADKPALFPTSTFVVTRKDGSSVAYQKQQYSYIDQIGTLTGHDPDSQKPAVETPEMILP